MRSRILPVIIFFGALFPSLSFAQLWTVTDPSLIPATGIRDIVPTRYVTYRIDQETIRQILSSAPDEFVQPVNESNSLLTVGMADGTMDVFKIVEYRMMEEELRAKYPDIRTFRGISTSDPYRIIRADWTTNGFRAVIRDRDGMTYIDPFQRDDSIHRIVYQKKDHTPKGQWHCEVEGRSSNNNEQYQRIGDCTFRSYRLAQATTGEYSNYFGATSSAQSALIMAEVVTAINRVNEVYELDVSVRLILVGNTDQIFYYNPATDPYNNGSGSQMLGQNQTTCDNVIGSANYDIGHVFSTGGGGVAYLNAICNNSIKAGGVTGQANPVGDPFYIDYVAHEMGHQFGANHTQNNNCNRVAATAMEPGSASTIMGYAGICPPNVQNNSDDYFHGISLQEIANRVMSTNCHVVVSTANSPPVVTNVPNYTIPISTPFVLTATASDPDSDPLTYCWEQWDEEVGTMPPVSTNTVGPMFRSLLPTSSPSRYFYNLPDLANNVNPTWEELPSVGRTMEFRITVRDFYNSMYGCTDEDNTIVTTVASAGPFTVTSQNAGATWGEGTNETITWNVANTTASPVSCANVEIRLSYDGGLTYPTLLASNEPNDGSASVFVPIGTTTEGRVMVKASNNIFFDINNADITIEAGLPNFSLSLDPTSVSECNDGSVQTTVEVGSFMGFTDPVTLSLLNPPPGAVVAFVPQIVIPGNSSTLTISNLTGLSGSYIPTVRGSSSTGNQDVNFSINLTSPVSEPALNSPFNHQTNVDLRPTLIWASVPGATSYDYQVSLNNSFSPVLFSGTLSATQILINTLLGNETTYYWRVRSNNLCGPSAWSDPYDFETMICQSYMSTDVPKAINSHGSPTINSILTILADEPIIDMNVISLTGTHTWVDDLKFTLISPGGSEVLFWDRPCDNHDNFNIHFDDEAADMNWPCPPTNGLTYKPNNSFTPFDGLNSSGTWILEVEDILNGEGGSLATWGLRVCRSSICELVVTETSGTGSGTLPGAFNCADAGDTILLSSSLSGQTINVGSSPLVINKNLTILSQSQDINVTGSGVRPFEVSAGTTVNFIGMMITAGTSLTGGAIMNQGTLTLEGVTIEKNASVSGATLIHNSGGLLEMMGACFIHQ